MKALRRILLLASGIMALVNLVGVFLDAVTLHWRPVPMALLHLAAWAAVCVYLIRLERTERA